MAEFKQIGFIGLGVMGEPVCRNLAQKSGVPVIAFDSNPAPLENLTAYGVRTADSLTELARSCDAIFLALPSGEIVDKVARGAGGLLEHARLGQVILDLSTSPVSITRQLHQDFAAKGAQFIDTPMARTRAAAEAGTLSIMVGGDPAVFERVKPLISTFAEEITLCGPIGSGQVVKILNNMVLFETVAALAEARGIARRAGVDPKVLLETFTRGSADSFALRNHGMKAMLPGEFPEKAFSVEYANKDLRYALQLAQQTGVDAPGARNVEVWFSKATEQGDKDRYWPVISRVIDRE